MNAWQRNFARKMDRVRAASQDRFEDIADRVMQPVFDEFHAFVSEQGLQAAAPLAQPGIRTFKFAASENCYVLVSFRNGGVEKCEMTAEFSLPNHTRTAPFVGSRELSDVNEDWARGMFEQALDQFADGAFAPPVDAEPAAAVG